MTNFVFIKTENDIYLSIKIFNIIENVCTLPGGTQQATCVRQHHCNYFQDLIRSYKRGRPPPDVVDNIKSHSCGKGDVSNY